MLIATGFVFVSRFFIEDRDGENIYIYVQLKCSLGQFVRESNMI